MKIKQTLRYYTYITAPEKSVYYNISLVRKKLQSARRDYKRKRRVVEFLCCLLINLAAPRTSGQWSHAI